MIEITKDDKIEINRILESVKGRIDQKLCKLIMDLIFQNKVGIKKEDERLFSTNQQRIPDSSIDAFSLGSFYDHFKDGSVSEAFNKDLQKQVSAFEAALS